MQPDAGKHHLTDEEILGILSRSKMGVIATIDDDGSPYTTPVNHILLDGRIFFHGKRMGNRASNILRDPRCSFCVSITDGFERCGDDACNTSTNYESVIVKGRVITVDEPDEKVRVLKALVDALVPERRDDPMDPEMIDRTEIFEIVVDRMTGKARRPVPGHIVYKNGV